MGEEGKPSEGWCREGGVDKEGVVVADKGWQLLDCEGKEAGSSNRKR